jgi:hypothetical protein
MKNTSIVLAMASVIGASVLSVVVSETVLAASASDANGPCLMALNRNTRYNKARRAPRSTADFTEILSSKRNGSIIAVRWRTLVFYSNGSTRPVLSGTCFVSADGRRVQSISFK